MELINKNNSCTEAFGTGYIERTEYIVRTSAGDEINGSLSGADRTDEDCINGAKKAVLSRLLDSLTCFKELLALTGDFPVTVGGEDGIPDSKNVSFLGFYDIESYEAKTQIESKFLEAYSPEFDNLYHEIINLNKEPYNEFFVEPDYWYSKNISFLDYCARVDNGDSVTPLSMKRVDLGRDDLKSAQEVIGGIDGASERLSFATERVARSIFGEELLVEGDRLFIIRRRDA